MLLATKLDATRPHAVPREIVLDLPAPISANQLWRKTKSGMMNNPKYERWKRRADAMLLEMNQIKGMKPISGNFTALIIARRSNLDLDAPTGCRVTLRALTHEA